MEGPGTRVPGPLELDLAREVVESFQPQVRERHTKIGGRIADFLPHWQEISKNKTVLSYVSGAKINFQKRLPDPVLDSIQNKAFWSLEQVKAVDDFVAVLIDSQVIEIVPVSSEQVVSPIFLTRNKDKTYRLIHNVKRINQECIVSTRFKMENLAVVLPLIPQFAWFTSWDIVQGFYNVLIHPNFRKYFCFDWKGRRFQFRALSMGSSESPRIFSKVVKASVYAARRLGLSVFSYMDDTMCMALSYLEAANASVEYGKLLEHLGFLLHPKKSVRLPTQCITYLGMIIDSRDMTVAIPEEKRSKLDSLVRSLLKEVYAKKPVSIRKAASLVGFQISCLLALPYGRAHYRSLEYERNRGLLDSNRDFDAKMILSWNVLPDLEWWRGLPRVLKNSFLPPKFSLFLVTDASLQGWGAVCGDQKLAGTWDFDDTIEIAFLELKAIWLAVKHLSHILQDQVIHLSTDNQVAQCYVNKMGGRRPSYNRVAVKIWALLEARNAFMSAFYVKSSDNVADPLSRLSSSRSLDRFRDIEFQLLPAWFKEISDMFGFQPEIDWFASPRNTQLPTFCVWEAGEGASFFDAFGHDWSVAKAYLFPPFALIPRVLRKIQLDRASGILIVPTWTAAPWWETALKLAKKIFHIPQEDPYMYPGVPQLRHNLNRMKLSAILF